MSSPFPVTATLDPLLGGLDRARWWVLVGLGPVGRRLIPRRDERVTALGLLTVAVALAGVVALPWWWLLWTPLVLGVPHLVADVRYLVLRPGWDRRARGLLLALPALAWAGGGAWVGGALLVALGVSEGVAGLVVAGLLGLCLVAAVGPLADLLLAHVHNLVALGLWWAWRPRPAHAGGVLGAVGLGALVVVALPVGWWVEASVPEGLGPLGHLARLAPDVGPSVGLRLVALFAFLQSVHYGVWTRWIPEDDRDRPTPRSFRASLRALEGDLGSLGLGLALGLGVLFPVWGWLRPGDAFEGYFRLAAFHAHLEVGAIGLLVARGRR